jgi:hypothetical protein
MSAEEMSVKEELAFLADMSESMGNPEDGKSYMRTLNYIRQLESNVAQLLAQSEARGAVVTIYEAAFDSLFGQCCSNPIRNAWDKQVDLSLLNDAHGAAGELKRIDQTIVLHIENQ